MSTPNEPSDQPLSRREAREARATGGVPEQPTSVPESTPAPVPAAPTDPVAPAPTPAPAAQPEATRAQRRSDAEDEDTTLTDMEDLFRREEPAVPDKNRKKKKRRGCLIGLLIFALVAGGITAGGIYVWNTYGDKVLEMLGMGEPKDYESGLEGTETRITIATDDTGESISKIMYNAGITKTETAFYDYLIDSGKNPTFYPGIYQMRTKLPASEALTMLENPDNKLENELLIIEGDTTHNVYASIAALLAIPVEDVEAAAADPSVYGVAADTLEGWLFPATYQLDDGMTAQQILQKLVDRMDQALTEAGVPADQRQTVLTKASVIQREARISDDFYKVSRVIDNRLAQDMKLEMDSTAQYGYGQLHEGDVWSSAEALADDNGWNTYVHTGLPKGPISLPGDEAIDAALHPADGDWIFFVTVNLDTGETVFSTNVDDHDAATAQLRQWCSDNPDAGC